tara:strand:+ start:103 stop:531 length:429 start_codon:yes stop_codon:yes gene_type:complete
MNNSKDSKKTKASPSNSNQNSSHGAIASLKQIKNSLFFIDKFQEKTNYTINKELAEINSLVEKNNQIINAYKIRKTKVAKTQKEINEITKMSTSIFEYNSAIIDRKIGLMEIHLKEVYSKITTVSKAITQLSDIMIENLEDK